MDKYAIFEKWQYIADEITKNVNANIREDIRQNIKLAMWKSLDSINVEQSIPTYLYTVAHNALKNEYRRLAKTYQYEQAMEIEESHAIYDDNELERVESDYDFSLLLKKASYNDDEKAILYMLANGYTKKQICDLMSIDRYRLDKILRRVRKYI